MALFDPFEPMPEVGMLYGPNRICMTYRDIDTLRHITGRNKQRKFVPLWDARQEYRDNNFEERVIGSIDAARILKMDQRDVLYRHFILGETYEEVAKVLGIGQTRVYEITQETISRIRLKLCA